MTELIRYEAACRAIAEAKTVDEVKEIRDVSIAMKAYARQAKNKEMEADAAEIRLRATRKLDQLVKAQKETVGLAKGGGPGRGKTGVTKTPDLSSPPTLGEAGIDKNLAKEGRKVGALSDEEFEEVVTETRKAVTGAARNVVNKMTKTEERDRREVELGAKINALAKALPLVKKRYGIILADPSWRFEPWSRNSGMDRAADNHYPTTPTDELAKLIPPAADDSALFLWAIVPMLPDAIRLMSEWGFTYKSAAVWLKDRMGTGYWFRNEMELLLVGTRGSIPAPAPGSQPRQIMDDPVGEHSVKPPTAHEFIERLFPSLPKLEMFARSGRDGWDTWGAEAPNEAAAE